MGPFFDQNRALKAISKEKKTNLSKWMRDKLGIFTLVPNRFYETQQVFFFQYYYYPQVQGRLKYTHVHRFIFISNSVNLLWFNSVSWKLYFTKNLFFWSVPYCFPWHLLQFIYENSSRYFLKIDIDIDQNVGNNWRNYIYDWKHQWKDYEKLYKNELL